MIIGIRDPFGFTRLFYDPARGASASTIAQLAGPGAAPDIPAIKGFLTGERLVGRTVLREVLAVPPGYALLRTSSGLVLRAPPPAATERADLPALLRASLQGALDSGKRVALALSGGLDSALLLALLHELGARQVPAYILATGMPGYCERAAALEMADRLQARVRIVHAGAAEFCAALPDAVRHVEEPMFNLHPVAKLLLARAMAADGIELAISGDGADQVLRRDRSANYLPLCKALFDAASVRLWAPFLDDAVVSHLTGIPPDPDKHCLRNLGATLCLPERLVRGPKRSRLAPAMDLDAMVAPASLQTLASTLGLPAPALRDDTERVLWATLLLTLEHLGASRCSS